MAIKKVALAYNVVSKIYAKDIEIDTEYENAVLNNIPLEENYSWRDATQAEIDAYKLAQIKQQGKQVIEMARKIKQYANIDYNGHTYHGTQTAHLYIMIQKLELTVKLICDKLNIPDAEFQQIKTQWVDVNYNVVPMNLLELSQLADKVAQNTRLSHLDEAPKQQEIANATNVSQIQNVVAGSYNVSLPTNQPPTDAFNQQLQTGNQI